MGRTYCRECSTDCVHGDVFFECTECEDTCEECAASNWDRCDFCGELQCPRCLELSNEECKSWPSEELCMYLDDGDKEADGYVIRYDCCGEHVYDGRYDLYKLDTVCPYCYDDLNNNMQDNYSKARKEHHDTRFWCSKCEEDGCDNEPCECKKGDNNRHRIMHWRMKNEGPTKIVDGTTWYWCRNEKREGKFNGLYMLEKPTGEESREQASSDGEEKVGEISTMMAAVATEDVAAVAAP